MRCGYSYKVFTAYDSIKGQQVLKAYIREKIENRALHLQVNVRDPKKDPVIMEYNRNVQRESRWLQRQKK